MNNRGRGIDGEQVVSDYLKRKGYQILERNYTKNTGEIDIIAKEEDTYVFVEVKNRTQTRFGEPIESVTPEKITKIVKTAKLYMVYKNIYPAKCRFDVVTLKYGEVENHIKSAFTAEDAGRRRHW